MNISLEFLPTLADAAFRNFDQALQVFEILPDCDDSMHNYWRFVAKDEAFRFEDRLRCYLSYGAFVSRETAKQMLRHRRILIEIGLLSKIEWDVEDAR